MRMHLAILLPLILATSAPVESKPPATGITVTVVQAVGALPEPLRPLGAPGDVLMTDGRFAALVGGSSRALRSQWNTEMPDPYGQLLAFAPVGASRRLATRVGSPAARAAGGATTLRVVSVRPDGESVVVRHEGTAGGQPIEVTTRLALAADTGELWLSAEVRNAGQGEIPRFGFGLGANFLQNLNFSPYHARLSPGLNFRVYQRPDHVLGWWNPNPVESNAQPLPGRLGPGEVHRMTYTLVAGTDVSDVLDRLYRLARVSADRQLIELRTAGADAGGRASGPGGTGETVEVQVIEPASSAVFYRAFLPRQPSLSVPLPAGTFRIRVHAFPAVRDRVFRHPWTDANGDAAPWTVDVPPLGEVRVALRDTRGTPVRGKVTFIGLAPTESPYFMPENPVESARGWESLNNSVYPAPDGETVVLPAGAYLAVAARGPAFTRETRVLEVYAGTNPDATFVIDEVVDASGFISVDAHMHTTFSDGHMSIAERLKGVVAEGVDVAVASDHNYITDYRPELARLGLENDLAVIVGNEVTGRGGNLHFNSFPLSPRPERPANGAISVADSTPGLLFDMTRKTDPGALIQVNHPRSQGLGYFLTYNLDPKTAAAADAPFVMNFDVMEAMNGAGLNGPNRATIEDWFHFLNRGYPIRIVGTSDAHGQDGGEPGYSRTYVQYRGPKGAGLDVPAVVRAIKEGRSFVSNGPIVTARVNGASTYGDTVVARDGRVSVEVEIAAAPWIDVSELRFVVNGVRRDPIGIRAPADDASTRKYSGRTELTMERDGWIAIEVTGRTTLFPTIQQRAASGRADDAPKPYALTNAIFIDVDGDGKVTAPWKEPIAIRNAKGRE